MRKSEIKRKTSETDISLALILDGSGLCEINTGCGFLDHMLELFARHGSFDITLSCAGDTRVDYHHTAEDAAIVLGQAFDRALGDRAGITRYGFFTLPMDEALILASVDLSGRAYLGWKLEFGTEKIGDFDTELIREFFAALSRTLPAAVHLQMLAGENSHHIAEAAFKASARALRDAVAYDSRSQGRIPSTKGTLL